MEGLIPLVFKVIKRNKVRRQYRCLSVGAAETYHIADFYDFGEHDHDHQGGKFDAPQTEARRSEFEGRSNGHHRRYGSAGEYNFNYDHDEVNGGSPAKQIMKRYRSHRMFSCITGGV